MHYFPFLSIAALRYCLVFRLVVQHYGGMMRRDSIERERLQFEMRRLFIGRDWEKKTEILPTINQPQLGKQKAKFKSLCHIAFAV